MQYVMEQYKWDITNGWKYYHIVDAKVFVTDKVLEEKSYNKDGSTFLIYKIEDEIQNTRTRTRKKRNE